MGWRAPAAKVEAGKPVVAEVALNGASAECEADKWELRGLKENVVEASMGVGW